MRQLILLTAISFCFLKATAQGIDIRFDKDGFYYPISGPVVSGKISWGAYQDYFMFKSDSNGEKQKIYLSEVKILVFKKDTLISLYYFDGKENKFYLGKTLVGSKTKLYSKIDAGAGDYDKQILNRFYDPWAPVSLSNQRFVMSNTYRYSVATSCYFGTDTPQETIKLDKTNFKEQMSNILADYPDMVAQIQSDKLTLKNFDAILKEYHSRKGGNAGK